MGKQIFPIEELLGRKLIEGSGFICADLKSLECESSFDETYIENIAPTFWNQLVNFSPLPFRHLRGKDIIFHQSYDYVGSLQHLPLGITTSISNITYTTKNWLPIVCKSLTHHQIPVICIVSNADEISSLQSQTHIDDVIVLDDVECTAQSLCSFSKDYSVRLDRWIRRRAAFLIVNIPNSHNIAALLWQLNMDLVIITTSDSLGLVELSPANDPVSEPLTLDDSIGYQYQHFKSLATKSQHRPGVTAIINLYRRPDRLLEIYNSLTKQSQPVSAIYIWLNSRAMLAEVDLIRDQMPRARLIISDENLGVWARFAFANLCSTQFCCIFDDDTVPGTRWIENCLLNWSLRPGLLGTVGLIYTDTHHYMNHQRVGWPSANSVPLDVDIVGHSWFFASNYLKYYWTEYIRLEGTEFCGEDMHFSFALQKYDIPTYVPPHPPNDKQLWGSLHPEYGMDVNAISISGKGSYMDLPFKQLLARGWQLLNQRPKVS